MTAKIARMPVRSQILALLRLRKDGVSDEVAMVMGFAFLLEIH